MKIYFDVPGVPQGKARPKVVRAKNGMSLAYTPDKTVAYEELVRQRFIAAANDQKFGADDMLHITITAYFPISKSKSKTQKRLMALGIILPTKKPDWDNIGKIICDSLNGIAYNDDSQIVVATVIKRYTDDAPHVLVQLRGGNQNGQEL